MASLLDNAHDALRMWRRHPGLVATAVLALALGVGAHTIFIAVNATLRELPLPNADRLIATNTIPWANVQEVRARVRTLVSVARVDSAAVATSHAQPKQTSGPACG